MAAFAEMRTTDIWYAHLSEDEVMNAVRGVVADKKAAEKKAAGKKAAGKKAKQEATAAKRAEKTAEKTRAKAYTRDGLQALSKLGELVDRRYRLVTQPPIVVPARELGAAYGMSSEDVGRTLHEQLRAYRTTLQDDRRQLLERFEMVDMARKVVGVGSVGTRAFIVLREGRDTQDPLFLQIKEATASVLEDHLPRSRYRQPCERVVQGQRMMQAASDIFLGWTRGVDVKRHYYWRQLRDMKGSALVEAMQRGGVGAPPSATGRADVLCAHLRVDAGASACSGIMRVILSSGSCQDAFWSSRASSPSKTFWRPSCPLSTASSR